jgi:hypothetical protein
LTGFISLDWAKLVITPFISFLLLLLNDINGPVQTFLSPQDGLTRPIFEEVAIDKSFTLSQLFFYLLFDMFQFLEHQRQEFWR